MKKTILYIGNLKHNPNQNPTTIDTLSEKLRDEGYHVITASSQANIFLRLLDMVYTLLKHIRGIDFVLIDTYSTLNFYYALIISALCRIFKTPYYPILHGGNLPQRLKTSKRLSTVIFKYSAVNISPSLYLKSQFEMYGYANIRYIPNAITLSNYSYTERSVKPIRLFWLRAFAELYNPLLAIKVLKRLVDKGYDASLTMVGPIKDNSFDTCKRFVETHKLPVHFKGQLLKKEWITLSKQHNIFINTTNFDNMPVSIIEAMALGLPIVSTNVGGLPYLIEANVDGVLVPKQDTQAMVDAILSLYNDTPEVLKLTQTARQKAEYFDWSQIKTLWIDILK